MANNINSTPASYLNNTYYHKKTIFIASIQQNDLILKINKLRDNIRLVTDVIILRVITFAHLQILSPLQHIFNTTINTEMSSTVFVITPVSKRGSKLNMNSLL